VDATGSAPDHEGSSEPGPPPEGPHDLSGLGIYDVLMDPDHPQFLNLGRLMWILVATPWDWVDRRVETVSLVGERRFRRHMSVDCRVPRVVTDLADELGLDRFFVPLRLVAERPLLSFDLRLGEQPVPFLTPVQHTMAERAVLRAAVEPLGRPLTDDLQSALDRVAAPGETGAAARALELLELSRPARRFSVGVAATAEALAHWAITTFDRHFLILADVPLWELRDRALFKITEERGTEAAGPLPFPAEIAWRPSAFMFDADDVVATANYHFQFIAPDGLTVAGGELLAIRSHVEGSGEADGGQEPDGRDGGAGGEPTDANAGGDGEETAGGSDKGGDENGAVRLIRRMRRGRGDRNRPARVAFGAASSQGQVLGVYATLDDVPNGDAYVVRAWLRPSPDGLLRASAISACFSTALLLAAVLFVRQVDHTRLEASAALMLVLPGLVSSLWLRPGEHSLVSRLFRGTRTLLLASVVIMYLAAASVLVIGAVPNRLRVAWLLLAVLSLLPSGSLVQALRRSQAFPTGE
jgi:hypothetical protein